MHRLRVRPDRGSLLNRSALFLVFCGLIPCLPCRPGCFAPGATDSRRLDAESPATQLERNLFSLLNRDRARRGLAPLVLDSSLTRIARDHSAEMADLGTIGHDLPSSGDLRERLVRAGYVVRKARENVACASSIEQAEAALLKSPGHLRNIMATDVSHVGVGIVRGSASHSGDLYITQIFVDPANSPTAEQLRRAQLTRIEEARRSSGLRPLRVEPLFDKTAARLIGSLKLPFKAEDLQRLLDDAAEQIPQGTLKDVSRVSLDVQLVRDERDLKVSDELRRSRASVLGTAARELHEAHGQATVAVLTLIGSR